jgi:hypothetical protein
MMVAAVAQAQRGELLPMLAALRFVCHVISVAYGRRRGSRRRRAHHCGAGTDLRATNRTRVLPTSAARWIFLTRMRLRTGMRGTL